jgi:hypothetical protein
MDLYRIRSVMQNSDKFSARGTFYTRVERYMCVYTLDVDICPMLQLACDRVCTHSLHSYDLCVCTHTAVCTQAGVNFTLYIKGHCHVLLHALYFFFFFE